MQHQPPQLLACLIHQLDDEKKEFVLSNISNEKKVEVEAIQVEKTPISTSNFDFKKRIRISLTLNLPSIKAVIKF